MLTTQLANQDPSSPMDSSQMVSQTAQLASMEQLTSLNTTVTSTNTTQMQSTATNLLGRSVTWTDKDGAAQSGVVTAVSFADPKDPTLTVGSSTVGLSTVTGVSAPGASSSS
ncbi:flagellar hook capping FlgD N-terminal domain-containing protein [Amnibacterium sp.]|uniref:flagellar hook capping FlgD N-terminal domain-containing protein n=1 Tax=Amnibacterium sp. TaxID=1872496 RepID=UPI003F7B95DB